MHILFSLGIILLGAWIAGKLIKKIKLPLVTAYILFGILISPDILNLVHSDLIAGSALISSIGLGLIAFNIGQNFVWADMKKLGRMVLVISFLESFTAAIIVTLGIHFLAGTNWVTSICMGALASATAPASASTVARAWPMPVKNTKTS